MEWTFEDLKRFTQSEYPYVREWGILKLINTDYELENEDVINRLEDYDTEVTEAMVHYIIARNQAEYGSKILQMYQEEERPIQIKYIIYLAQTKNEEAIPYFIEDFHQRDILYPKRLILASAFKIYDHDETTNTIREWIYYSTQTRSDDEIEDFETIYDIAVSTITSHGNLKDILFLYKLFLTNASFRNLFDGRRFDDFLLSNYIQEMFLILEEQYQSGSKNVMSELTKIFSGFKGHLHFGNELSSSYLRELDELFQKRDSERLITSMYQHLRSKMTQEGLINTDIKSIELQYPHVSDHWRITHYAILELLYSNFEHFKKLRNEQKRMLLFVAICCFYFVIGYDENMEIEEESIELPADVFSLSAEEIFDRLIYSGETIERVGLSSSRPLFDKTAPKVIKALDKLIRDFGEEEIVRRCETIIKESENDDYTIRSIYLIQSMPIEQGAPILIKFLSKAYRDLIRETARDALVEYGAEVLDYIGSELKTGEKQKNPFYIEIVFSFWFDDILDFVLEYFDILWSLDRTSTLKYVINSGAAEFIDKLQPEVNYEVVDEIGLYYTLLCDLHKKYDDTRLNEMREKVITFRKEGYENHSPYILEMFSS